MQLRPITRSFMATFESFGQKPLKAVPVLNTESIAFQKNDMFGPNLEAIVSKYSDMADMGGAAKAIKGAVTLHSELERLVADRLGIKVKLHTDQGLAAVIPNVYIPHNPIIRDEITWIYENWEDIGAQDKLKKLSNKTVIGTVNTQTAKVSGWFSEQELPIFIDFYALFKTYKMSIPEVTAIILHELGHAFEAIVFCSNINKTNQILADLARHVKDKQYAGDVDYVYAKIKELDPKATRDIAQALASGNNVVMSVATYRLFVNITQTLMSDRVYDRTSFEAIADNFTARFGYAFHIVTGLEKLENDYSEYNYSKEMYESSLMAVIYTGLMTVGLVICAITGAAGAWGAIGAVIFGLLTKVLFDNHRPSQKAMTYDNIRDRYIRMRNQLVELIKDKELGLDAKTSILEQVKLMDDIISKKQVYVGILERFAKYAIPSDRRTIANINMQQEMEKLIANNLFISANRLALLGNKQS